MTLEELAVEESKAGTFDRNSSPIDDDEDDLTREEKKIDQVAELEALNDFAEQLKEEGHHQEGSQRSSNLSATFGSSLMQSSLEPMLESEIQNLLGSIKVRT